MIIVVEVHPSFLRPSENIMMANMKHKHWLVGTYLIVLCLWCKASQIIHF